MPKSYRLQTITVTLKNVLFDASMFWENGFPYLMAFKVFSRSLVLLREYLLSLWRGGGGFSNYLL